MKPINLDRASGGRVLCATIAPNTEDYGGQATISTPWRVMSWSAHQVQPDQPSTASVIDDLTDILSQVEQLQAGIDMLRARVRVTLNQIQS